MRTSLLPLLLLAGTAAPALAEPADSDLRPGFERPQRAERSAGRAAERSEQRSEGQMPRRPSIEDSGVAPISSDPAAEAGRSGQPRFSRGHGGSIPVSPALEGQAVRSSAPPEAIAPRASGAGDTVRGWRMHERARPDSPTVVEQRNLAEPPTMAPAPISSPQSIEERNLRRPQVIEEGQAGTTRRVRTTPGFGDRRLPRIGNNVPIEGTVPPVPPRAQLMQGQTAQRWRRDWQNDGRYDWRQWRNGHRSRFRIGTYWDPFGWNYRRYSIGWRLWPSYYSDSYWLNDPWYWRLPPAYGPYRWIRYHGDALLVNIYTGEVVDAVYGFFW